VTGAQAVARKAANRLFFQNDFLTHNQVCRFVTAHWVACLSILTRNCATCSARTVGR
jgi:hypothetical protein